jgi:hypothetical protein
MKPYIDVTKDFTEEFNKIVKSFKRDAVLVGIPQEEGPRDADALINNAALLAINNFGSPLNNIPPRPVMSIGIKNAQEQISQQFKLAVQKTFFEGSTEALTTYYNRAGIIASNSIKKAINSQEGIEPPSEATLASRKSAGFAGKKALIVTGQMRNAITYVVKEGA